MLISLCHLSYLLQLSIATHVKSDQETFSTYFIGSIRERAMKRPSVVVLYISVVDDYN